MGERRDLIRVLKENQQPPDHHDNNWNFLIYPEQGVWEVEKGGNTSCYASVWREWARGPSEDAHIWLPWSTSFPYYKQSYALREMVTRLCYDPSHRFYKIFSLGAKTLGMCKQQFIKFTARYGLFICNDVIKLLPAGLLKSCAIFFRTMREVQKSRDKLYDYVSDPRITKPKEAFFIMWALNNAPVAAMTTKKGGNHSAVSFQQSWEVHWEALTHKEYEKGEPLEYDNYQGFDGYEVFNDFQHKKTGRQERPELEGIVHEIDLKATNWKVNFKGQDKGSLKERLIERAIEIGA